MHCVLRCSTKERFPLYRSTCQKASYWMRMSPISYLTLDQEALNSDGGTLFSKTAYAHTSSVQVS